MSGHERSPIRILIKTLSPFYLESAIPSVLTVCVGR
jgi:hypothetical protein